MHLQMFVGLFLSRDNHQYRKNHKDKPETQKIGYTHKDTKTMATNTQTQESVSNTVAYENIIATFGSRLKRVHRSKVPITDPACECANEFDTEPTTWHWMQLQSQPINKIDPCYMTHQKPTSGKPINEAMRIILIDWLMGICKVGHFLSDTIHLAVFIIDKYLSRAIVPDNRFQLLGATAIMIAAKIEEPYPLDPDLFVRLGADTYTLQELLANEELVLHGIQANVFTPTVLTFVRRFSQINGSDQKTHMLCKYLAELALLNYSMLQYDPSMRAAAVLYLARHMTKSQPTWVCIYHCLFLTVHLLKINRQLRYHNTLVTRNAMYCHVRENCNHGMRNSHLSYAT